MCRDSKEPPCKKDFRRRRKSFLRCVAGTFAAQPWGEVLPAASPPSRREVKRRPRPVDRDGLYGMPFKSSGDRRWIHWTHPCTSFSISRNELSPFHHVIFHPLHRTRASMTAALILQEPSPARRIPRCTPRTICGCSPAD